MADTEEEPEKVNRYCGSRFEEVELEKIQAEVAQYLQLDNLSFLVGAGCSSHIVGDGDDKTEKGIPGMGDLYEGFFSDNPDFEVAGKKAKDLYDRNLEKMLGTMYAISAVNETHEVDGDIDEKIAMVQGYIRQRIASGLNGKEVSSFYKGFYQSITSRGRKSPISIFTTNYDLYNERALDELRFPYNDGFSGTYRRTFDPASYRYALVEDMRLSHDTWDRVPNYFNLYKLHGSISWKRDGRDGEDVRETDYESIDPSEAVMIYPTPLKDRSTLMMPYSDLFRLMENCLMRSNSVLIVMGYSFGDDHINRLIFNALAVPTFKLVIFGESPQINKLQELGDNRIVVFNSKSKIHYFNNLVEKVFPSASDDFLEQIKTRDSLRNLAKLISSAVPNDGNPKSAGDKGSDADE